MRQGGRGPMCIPHAATHVPLALSGYATTSSVLAIVWSLVRSTVSSTPPIALTGGRSQRGPGCDDSKNRPIPCEQQPATPCLVLDVDRVEDNFRALRRTLPLARIYYAVKANPAPQILERLVGLSSFFDAASYRRSRGVPRCRRHAGGDQLRQHDQESVGDPTRALPAASRCSRSTRSRNFEKLAKHAPGARVYCRLLVENEGADWPLSRKFGTTVENARALMLQRRRDGAGSIRTVVPCRQSADHDARLRSRDRQGRRCCSPT